MSDAAVAAIFRELSGGKFFLSVKQWDSACEIVGYQGSVHRQDVAEDHDVFLECLGKGDQGLTPGSFEFALRKLSIKHGDTPETLSRRMLRGTKLWHMESELEELLHAVFDAFCSHGDLHLRVPELISLLTSCHFLSDVMQMVMEDKDAKASQEETAEGQVMQLLRINRQQVDTISHQIYEKQKGAIGFLSFLNLLDRISLALEHASAFRVCVQVASLAPHVAPQLVPGTGQ